MRFYFHEHAETEFDRTVEYYIYQVKSGFVRIIAVADLRRRPDYWLDRE